MSTPRRDAEAAHLVLLSAFWAHADAGRPAPCLSDPDPFTSERTHERVEAAAACIWCPVRVECAAFAEARRERWHVWGGVDRTRPDPRLGGHRTEAAS